MAVKVANHATTNNHSIDRTHDKALLGAHPLQCTL
ncbi:uncharacterized protein G2W53_011940 [Senna tora]|uniref:Uncharacterized protein n=1 Tax=Senna tora TaxID=362788 RepID=A0A834TWW9_9FABA|nr:uncharacterized protein G2W53_011940 [Senna tora]